jgi:hypothetical protein
VYVEKCLCCPDALLEGLKKTTNIFSQDGWNLKWAGAQLEFIFGEGRGAEPEAIYILFNLKKCVIKIML